MKFILSQKKNINWNLQDPKGCTTAMHAVVGGNRECVEILSQIEGIDWNLQDGNGDTAVMWMTYVVLSVDCQSVWPSDHIGIPIFITL